MISASSSWSPCDACRLGDLSRQGVEFNPSPQNGPPPAALPQLLSPEMLAGVLLTAVHNRRCQVGAQTQALHPTLYMHSVPH